MLKLEPSDAERLLLPTLELLSSGEILRLWHRLSPYILRKDLHSVQKLVDNELLRKRLGVPTDTIDILNRARNRVRQCRVDGILEKESR